MKITKSELKNMIREALQEELANKNIFVESAKSSKVLKETTSVSRPSTVCYVCGKPVGRDVVETLFGFVHHDCWEAFMDMPEWGADHLYNASLDGTALQDTPVTEPVTQQEVDDYINSWRECCDKGVIPLSKNECDEIFNNYMKNLENCEIYSETLF